MEVADANQIIDGDNTLSIDNNDVTMPSESLQFLEREDDPAKQQVFLDNIFTPKRRDEILRSATPDRHGRPARYFRLMTYQKLIDLLSDGEQTYRSYYDSLDAPVLRDDFEGFVQRVAITRASQGEETIGNITEDIKKGINFAFKDFVSKEMLDSLSEKFQSGTLSYGELISLIDAHLPLEIILGIHSGQRFQMFSPLLSLSIGGPIRAQFPPDKKAYVELAMPANAIIPDDPLHKPISREMEVFTRRVGRRYIIRVYTDEETLKENEITNSTTSIYPYYVKTGDARKAVDEWRFNEDIDDYLPISLVDPR